MFAFSVLVCNFGGPGDSCICVCALLSLGPGSCLAKTKGRKSSLALAVVADAGAIKTEMEAAISYRIQEEKISLTIKEIHF